MYNRWGAYPVVYFLEHIALTRCPALGWHAKLKTEGMCSALFCNHCGSKNPDGSNFCSNCGKALVSSFSEQNEDTVRLHTVEIFRESQLFLLNPPINLSIVGSSTTKKISIANGETAKLELPPAMYEFTFSQSMRKRTLSIDLQSDIHIDVKWNRITGAIEANIN